MSSRLGVALTVLAIVALVAGPLLLARSSDTEFEGVDAQAVEEAARIDPDHEPWITPLWSPPGTETESLLFALQAALGAGVLGYVAGAIRTRSRLQAETESVAGADG